MPYCKKDANRKIKTNYLRCSIQKVRALFKIILIAFVVSFSVSCKKDKVITSSSARLTFSQPNIMFDTVFTSIGSTTQLFRVHNPNNGEVNISSISLARGNASFYRLNVDGVPGKSFSNVQIAAKDSMYIFVEVTINPSFDPVTSPFIYRDSIIFHLNGNTQYFSLTAFGQNAYYHMGNQSWLFSSTQAISFDTLPIPINSTDTFKNDKPHLLYGFVFVDSYQKLYVEPGTKIYVHGSGGIWVYQNGSINIAGTPTDSVTIQGDRLEQEYKDVPGQWDRILINEGGTNTITNAVIKNAYIGIQAGFAAFSFGTKDNSNIYNSTITPNLTINSTVIQNCSQTGILGQAFAISGGDNVVVNCGQNLLEFDLGGSYSFYQCTFANYWNQTNNSSTPSARTTPSFNFNDYNSQYLIPFTNLSFGNCIFDGTLAEEFNFDTLAQINGFTTPYSFNYCALKTGTAFGTHAMNCQINQSMNFINTTAYNFDLNPGSKAISTGSTSANGGYMTDINGHTFANPNPNMGAYAN